MQGSLRLHAGVLYVGRHALTAEVASYDLDGRALETRIRFRDERTGRSSVDGLDVDEDRRIWVADGAAERVRCFSLFGREVASVGDDPAETAKDRRGALGAPVDLRVVGADDETRLLVASAGRRRHALQVLHVASGRGRSIAPLGESEGRFDRIRGIDHFDGTTAVAEAAAARVQVFDGDLLGRVTFRFAFPVPAELGAPEAVAVVGDGRLLVATAGARSGLHVFDASGSWLRALASDEASGDGGEARVDAPAAIAIERDGPEADRARRVAVLDRDGERVQVLSLDGRAFGSFQGFAGA